MLDASLSGRTAELPVGTKIVLYFPGGGFDISVNPTKGVVEGAKGTYNLSRDEIGVLEVVGQGPATITVTNVNYNTTFIIPTPTLSPGQKAIYTLYIQATPHKVNPRELSLTPFDTGKTFSVDIGTLIALKQFGIGNYHISVSSPQAIFKDFNPTKTEVMHFPIDVIGAVRVYRAGIGTIQVIETDSAVFDSHIRCHSPKNVNHKNQTSGENLLLIISSHVADFYACVNQKTRPLLSQELALEVGSRFLRTQVGVVGGHLFS